MRRRIGDEPDPGAPAPRRTASAQPRSARPVQGPPTVSDEQLDELIMGLEHDQLVVARSGPLPRARLGGRSRMALWALRIFVLIVGAMVIYTFFAQL